MPVVPRVEGPSVALQAAPNAYQSAAGATPDAFGGGRAQLAGQAALAAGAYQRLHQQEVDIADQVRFDDAVNQAKERQIARTFGDKGFTALKGKAALERESGMPLEDEYGGEFRNDLAEIAKGLGNERQKRAFAMRANDMLTGFREQVMQHRGKETQTYRLSVREGTIENRKTEVGFYYNDPGKIDEALLSVRAAVTDAGKVVGLAAEQIEAKARVETSNALVIAFSSALANSDTKAAAAILDRYGKPDGAMMPAAVDKAREMLKTHGLAQVAQERGAVLAEKYSYLDTAKALKEIDGMDLPAEQKQAVRADVEHRHAVAQADDDKRNAVVVGKLHEMAASGMSLARIQATPEYMAARDKGAIIDMVNNNAYTRVLRANANDERSIRRLQRHEAELHVTQSDKAFAYSDPVVLARTPREKIAGLLPVIGQQWTHELLAKKDALDKGGAAGLKQATMDRDDIKAIAKDFFQIDPSNLKSKEDKAAYLDFVSRAERVIAADPAGKVMSREEKYDRLAKEAARTVLVDPGAYSRNRETPVMMLTPDTIKKVVIPKADEVRVIEMMRTQYKSTGGKVFEPTPENVRKWYLVSKGEDPESLFGAKVK